MTTNSELLLNGVSAGNASAEREFFARFAVRAQALAAKRLRRQISRAADADDVAQSALHCFFAGAREQRWQHERSGDLWRLLAAIVINKCRAHVRHAKAAKRDIRRLRALDGDNSKEVTPTEDGPSTVVRTWEAASLVFANLTELERELVRLKLNDADTNEIAQQLGISDRSARRKLAELEAKLRGQLSEPQSCDDPTADFAALDDPRVCAQMQRIRGLVPNIAHTDLLLEQLIGAGGIGKVFRAVHIPTAETVAVKALAKKHHRHAEAVSSLLNEAAVLAELQHPRIVPLRGIGQFPSGGLFLVMDLVRGESLAKRMGLGKMPEQLALQIAADIAAALDAAHAMAIVHCDLKPANILLNHAGRAFVTDFGFARFGEAQDTLSSERPVIGGTPAFAAPELWDADRDASSPSADIYAWGKVLLGMFAGQVPHEPAESLRMAAKLPGHLGEICRVCLQENPRDRYQSAAECLDAVRSALHSAGTSARNL